MCNVPNLKYGCAARGLTINLFVLKWWRHVCKLEWILDVGSIGYNLGKIVKTVILHPYVKGYL